MPPARPDFDHARQARHALWAALVMIVVWDSNFTVQKAVFAAVSPGGFLFAHYLMMPIAAALLLLSRHGLKWPRVPRADLIALLKLGLAGHLLHVGLVTYGIHWSTAFSSSLILAMGPVFTLLILRWQGVEDHLSRGQVLVSAFLGWLVWGWVNAVRGVARSAPLMYLMPPVAGMVAWLVTGERYTGVKLAGAALTLGGVALAQLTSSRTPVVRDSPAPVD